MKKSAFKTIKKYRDPLLMLSHMAFLLSGAILAKWPTWVEVWAAPLSPVNNNSIQAVYVTEPYKSIDTIVDSAVYTFLPTHQSESKMIMHCLLHRESGHGASNARGDGGLAIGPLQFHQSTWDRMRKAMIKDGKATEIGSPLDLEAAIYTTAYAISKGWAREWGPILRNSKGSNYAACQTPSWY